MPKKISQYFSERSALWVVLEVALEDVLDILWVCCHDGAPGAKPPHDDGVGRGLGQELGVPVQKAAPVPVEGYQAPDDRVGRRAMARDMEDLLKEVGREHMKEVEHGEEEGGTESLQCNESEDHHWCLCLTGKEEAKKQKLDMESNAVY